MMAGNFADVFAEAFSIWIPQGPDRLSGCLLSNLKDSKEPYYAFPHLDHGVDKNGYIKM